MRTLINPQDHTNRVQSPGPPISELCCDVAPSRKNNLATSPSLHCIIIVLDLQCGCLLSRPWSTRAERFLGCDVHPAKLTSRGVRRLVSREAELNSIISRHSGRSMRTNGISSLLEKGRNGVGLLLPDFRMR